MSKVRRDPSVSIVAAAIDHKGLVCFVPAPGRHHDVIRKMAEAGMDIPITGKQGFVTNMGKFVDRVEARKIAEASGQIIETVGSDGVPFKRDHPQLFSEDLW